MRLFVLLLFLLVANICHADVYLVVDKNDEVVSMSKRNDAVIQGEWEKIILPGGLTDYELQYHPQYYKYKDGKFVVNVKKLSDETLALEAAEEVAKEEAEVNKKIRSMAIEELKKEGKIFKHIKED